MWSLRTFCFQDGPFDYLINRNYFLLGMVEPRGIEPLTFALRTRRSPS
jgi:hypothetical protein